MNNTVTPINVDEILANARAEYKKSDDATRAMLVNLFGTIVVPKDITERIKTFEDACKELELDPAYELSHILSKDVMAYLKLKIIIRALNEGWTPDFTNGNEYKYYPWFKFVPGSGFSLNVVRFGRTLTNVGARLCFKERKLAEYAATQFIDIYNDYLQ